MRVLLAIDDSACSDAAIQAVVGQIRPQDAEVRVLHVVEWPKGLPTSVAFAEGPEAASQILGMHDEVRRRGQSLISGAAERLKAEHIAATTEMREGDARRAILDCADEWRPDLIVLGSHGRRGLDRFLLGSVSDTVVRHAPCSVEVVREPR